VITPRESKDRGFFDFGWLKTHHTFSFADYYDPNFMGFRSLRVINEDYISRGKGFGTHPHRDMEIITYIVEGELQHKDSMENGSVIRPGEIQYMSAGSGVTHSEFNPSEAKDTHLLQIWIVPNEKSAVPRYDQKKIQRKKDRPFTLMVSNEGSEGSIAIRQDVRLYTAQWAEGTKAEYKLDPKRFGWIQVVHGDLQVNEKSMKAGDGAAINDENLLRFQTTQPTEFLLFDLS
jgi:quercetin 2,3-dioxygenase